MKTQATRFDATEDTDIQDWLNQSGPEQMVIAEKDGLEAETSAYIYDIENGKHYAVSATQTDRNEPDLAYCLEWSDAHPDKPVLGCVDLKSILDGDNVMILLNFHRQLKKVVTHDLHLDVAAVHVVPHGDVQQIDSTLQDGKLNTRTRHSL